jgi:hypothetical protein
MVTRLFAVAFAVTISLVTAGCVQGGPPHSKLIHLTLPEGSTRNTEGRQPGGHEAWAVPKPYDDTVAQIRSQLPLHRDFEGVPWSGEQSQANPPSSVWEWKKSDNTEFIRVEVAPAEYVEASGHRIDMQKCAVIIDHG